MLTAPMFSVDHLLWLVLAANVLGVCAGYCLGIRVRPSATDNSGPTRHGDHR